MVGDSLGYRDHAEVACGVLGYGGCGVVGVVSSMGTLDSFQQVVIQAVKNAAEKEAEKVIADAVADFEKRLRREIGLVAMEVSSYYQIDRREDHLIITVKS